MYIIFSTLSTHRHIIYPLSWLTVLLICNHYWGSLFKNQRKNNFQCSPKSCHFFLLMGSFLSGVCLLKHQLHWILKNITVNCEIIICEFGKQLVCFKKSNVLLKYSFIFILKFLNVKYIAFYKNKLSFW